MQHFHDHLQSSQVTALFTDRALSFVLPKGATFEDLVDGLAFLGARGPLAVIVNLGWSEQKAVVPITALRA